MPEQALGGIPLGFGIVVEDQPSELSVYKSVLAIISHLCPWHGFWVHGIIFDSLAFLHKPCFQQSPNHTLTRTRRPHNDHTHPLLQLFVELKSLVDLYYNKQIKEAV